MSQSDPPGGDIPSGDVILAELARVVRSTRELVESSPIPRDASIAAVMFTTYILLAEERGLPREAVHKVLDYVWDLNEVT